MAFLGHFGGSKPSLFVISLIVFIVKSQGHDEEILEKLNDLKTEVNALDAKLDIVDSKLDTLLGALGNNSKASGGDSDVGKTTVAPNRPADLVSAERAPLSDERNRFTIRLKNKSDGELVIRLFGDGPERTPDDVMEEAGGLLAVSLNTSIQSETLFLQIFDPELDDALSVTLKNFATGQVTQNLRNVTIPVLQVSPESEVVYDPGQNVNVTASVLENNLTAELQSLSVLLSGVDLTSRDYKTFWSPDDLFETYVHPETPGKVEKTFHLNTAEKPVSGYLSVYMDLNMVQGAVVRDIQVTRHLLVRPADQAGPYPPGYLKVVEMDYLQKSKNGHELTICRPDKECWLSCYSVGESVTDMTVMMVQPDGGMSYIPSTIKPPQYLSSMQSIHWQFDARPDSGDSDGITTFMCSAFDQRTGQTAVKLLDVQVPIEGAIDTDRSSAVVDVDPNDPEKRRLTLNCAISGRPLPDVFFYEPSNDDSFIFPENPDEVISTGENEGIARKVYTVEVLQLEELDIATRMGSWSSFSCSILSLELLGLNSTYYFDI